MYRVSKNSPSAEVVQFRAALSQQWALPFSVTGAQWHCCCPCPLPPHGSADSRGLCTNTGKADTEGTVPGLIQAGVSFHCCYTRLNSVISISNGDNASEV